MKKNPIWENNSGNNLNDSVFVTNTDILIIGGGITGISTAYFLMESNKSVVLIDKGLIGEGATYKSTAKVTFLQKDIYQKLERIFNYNTSKLYFESQVDAINLIKKIISFEKIDCDFSKTDTYLFTLKDSGIKKVEKEKNMLEKFGVESFSVDKLPIDFKIKYGFFIKDSYVFNPKKYIDALANKICNKTKVYENTTCLKLYKEKDGYSVLTNKGIIKANKVIVATHYPFFILPNFIPIKNYISKEYVNASKYETTQRFSAINVDKDIASIRFYNNYLIYVSNNHKLTNKLNYQEMYKKGRDIFFKKFGMESEYSWMNQDLMTNDNLPFIGYSSKSNKNLLLATGYNGFGITNGCIAGKILADLVLDKDNKYKNIFRVNRVNLNGIINSLVDGALFTKAYIQAIFYKEDNIKRIKIKGELYNVYIDKDKKRHYVKAKCPHMKCNLIFNKEELTWDCPCHGSRFDLDGNIIEAPSKNDIIRD